MKLLLAVSAFLIAAAPTAPAQEAPSKKEVNEAIDNGSKWLLSRFEGGFDNSSWNSTMELVMLTLSHARVPKDNEVFQKGLKAMTDSKLQYNYRVALHAMALAHINPEEHRGRLAHCAQWIVDTQCAGGEWGYAGALTDLNATPDPITVDPPKVGKRSGKGSSRSSVKIKRRAFLNAKATGDISNTQFSLLGLRACAEAGFKIPKSTWKKADAFLGRIQWRDGGWGYYINKMKDKTTYASMTCAGICSVAITDHYLKRKPKKDGRIKAGMRWLAKNWSLGRNTGVEKSHVVDPKVWHYYYLYSIERTGRIMETDTIGKHDWYAEGARWLLDKQKSDGSWTTGLRTRWKQAGDLEVADSCFAILFLAKATRPLVATGGSTRKKK